MNQDEHRKRCLARWLLDHWPSKSERLASLERIRKNAGDGGDQLVAELRELMRMEWESRKQGSKAA